MAVRLDPNGRMSNPPRLQIPGAIYHVMARGNRKGRIFRDGHDRAAFSQMLAIVAEALTVEVLTEARMGTHYHGVVMTPKANLSRFMQRLNTRYARYFNRRYKQVGHVFRGRFKAVIVQHDVHLLTTIGYVLKNPVEANLAADVAAWQWSSYRATIGLAEQPSYLSLSWLDAIFPAATRAESQQQFADFIHSGRPAHSFLDGRTPAAGTPAFLSEIRVVIGRQCFDVAVPRGYRMLGRPTLGELFEGVQSKDERNAMIRRAQVVHGYTLAEIARSLGLHPASVSRILCLRRKRGADPVT
jgi:REP element-mobilizing transposase RayT